jgi:AcrR family transcriptional regulator
MKKTSRTYKSTSERQLELLHVAAQLIAEKGLVATTIPDIAARAGLSVGAVYRHFESKAALLAALVAADAARLLAKIKKAAANCAHPKDALHAWSQAQLVDLADPIELGLRAEIVALAAHDPAIRESVCRHGDAVEGQLRDLLAAAAKPGSLFESDPDAAVELVATVIDGIQVRGAIVGRIDSQAAKLVDIAIAAAIATPVKK